MQEGITGKPKAETFRCPIGYRDCFIGDGESSYGGPGWVARGKLTPDIIGSEVEALYTNGPAGGCGAVKHTRDIVSVASILLDMEI